MKPTIKEIKKAIADAIKSGEAKMTVRGLHWSCDGKSRIAEAQFDLGEGEMYELGVFEVEDPKKPLITFYTNNLIAIKEMFTTDDLVELTQRVWTEYHRQEAEVAAKRIEELKAEIARLEKIGKGVA